MLGVLLLAFAAMPVGAETGSQGPATQSLSGMENEVLLTSGAVATLQASPELVSVALSSGERFTAPNPFKGSVDLHLERLESEAGDHLVAQVSAGDKVHAWVLMPQEGDLRLGLEIADVQTIRVAGDLVMVGIVTPISGGKTSVASRIYRYSTVSNTYEKTATPVGTGGGPSYPIPPSLQEPAQHETAAEAPVTRQSLLYGLLVLFGAALGGGIGWFAGRRSGRSTSVTGDGLSEGAVLLRYRKVGDKLDWTVQDVERH